MTQIWGFLHAVFWGRGRECAYANSRLYPPGGRVDNGPCLGGRKSTVQSGLLWGSL
jgi:hypothetical protein